MLVEGHSARVRSLNLVGLKRAGLIDTGDRQIFQPLKQAFRILYRSGLSLNAALEKLETLLDNEYVQHLHRFLQLSQQKGRRGPTPGGKSGHEGEEDE